MGVNLVAGMIPKLCVSLGLPRYTNNSLRPTAIRQMKRGGAEDREIMSVSKHKKIETLSHYQPDPSSARKRHMAESIANGGRKIANLENPTPSTSKQIEDSETFFVSEDDLILIPTNLASEIIVKRSEELPDNFLEKTDKKSEKENEKKAENPENSIEIDHLNDENSPLLTQGDKSGLKSSKVLVLLEREQQLAAQETARRQESDKIRLSILKDISNKLK